MARPRRLPIHIWFLAFVAPAAWGEDTQCFADSTATRPGGSTGCAFSGLAMAKAEGYAGDATTAPKIEPAAAEALARDGEQEDLAPLAATQWPERFKSIKRYKYESLDKFLAFFKDHASRGVPLIVEGTKVMDPEKWTNLDHLSKLLSGKPVLVKRSRSSAFRYYDLKKNSGNYSFEKPIQEFQKSLEEFLQDSEGIRREGLPDRMYLQETLSGHAEMAEEFVSWNWEFLIRCSSESGWGLPDSNELFVGMQGAETPLHFDERENLFFQVRGKKEICLFPFTDYTRLYPFPTTHPCDRQSMVGDPRSPDLQAFPEFESAVGHVGVLEAGDLLYLPYGWWHWLRNLDHLAISVSFWSTTPPNDLSKGVPTTFSDHMLTRVRRNLESMVAQQHGPSQHNASMLSIKKALEEKEEKDPGLQQVRGLLAAVRMPKDKQDIFLMEMIDGRFGIDWSKHV